ncbi:sensor domain-containing protein [Leucothrix pacifica]|nr:EAL domain-containing protein [Leucothrix pacifica]
MDFLKDQAMLLVAAIAALLVVMLFMVLKKRKRGDSASSACSEALAVKEEILKMVPNPVVLLTGQYTLVYLNPAAEKLLDSPLRRNLGKPVNGLFQLFNTQTKLPVKDYLDLNHAGASVNQAKLIHCIVKYQQSINAWMNVTIQPIELHEDPMKSQYAIFLEDVTATRAVESQLNYMERHDSQTGLLNRKAFEAVLKASIDDAKKHGSSHVFMALSIDQFKTINDTVGYAAGDSLITKVVSVLKQTVAGEGDNIGGRLAGNDFGVLFKESTLFSAANKMKIIRDEIGAFQFNWNTRTFPVTLSGGFVVIKKDTSSAARVLTESDIACRTARNHGGNRVIAYRAESAEMRQEQSNMEGVWNLKKAFKNNSFELFAQPIHPLKESQFGKPFSHYELLIRMVGEDSKFVPPDEFIPVAEYYSMMPELDRWVVREAFSYIAQVEPTDNPPVFAINLSGQSLDEASFRDFVMDELKTSGADARMICFEITEAVAVNDLTLATRFISSLKAEGSSFSLDDFGTGVSSYGYLQSLDVDYLKIDGIFVKDLIRDGIARNIVESVTQVGHSMGLKIIAEYVEDDKIISLLRKMGVDYGQGYGICKPKPLEEMIVPHLAAKKKTAAAV